MRGRFRFPLWETDHKKGRRHGDGKGNAATLPGGNTAVEGSYRGRQEPEKKMETEKKIKRQVAVRKNCKKYLTFGASTAIISEHLKTGPCLPGHLTRDTLICEKTS